MKTPIKSSICVLFSLFALSAHATQSINVTVKTNEKSAIAVGFSVEGRHLGGLGKAFSAKGPSQKEYTFGFKKDSIFGENIACGSLLLKKNTTVLMIYQNNQCVSLIQDEAS